MVRRLLKKVRLGRVENVHDLDDVRVSSLAHDLTRILRMTNSTEYQRERLDKRGGWLIVRQIVGKGITIFGEFWYDDKDGPMDESDVDR